MIKNTLPDHEDFKALTKAKDKMQELNLYINKKKQESETRMKLIEIQDAIYSPAPFVIVAPARLYVKDGPVELEHAGERFKGAERRKWKYSTL